jgi:NADP-reducing hydrogenase subunit HndB
MNSLEELAAIRESMKSKIALREGYRDTRIVVGMATCGIAAGARPVLNALVEAVAEEGLTGQVSVTQSGCIGLCRYEPIVEVYQKGKAKVTYVNMTAEKAVKVLKEHVENGKVVEEYTLAYAEKA